MITQTAVLEDKNSACLLKVRIAQNEKQFNIFLYYRGNSVYGKSEFFLVLKHNVMQIYGVD
jgi:hypothetical protein